MKALRENDTRQIGPYRVLAEVGRGGMGRVLLGAAPDGRLVAVKQVHGRFAADQGFRARFRREVEASRRVSGAYTAAVMDADPEAASPWLASEFVAGPSLGDVVERTGPLPEQAVRDLVAGLAAALVEIHRAGLVHRDLKPDNVLLVEDGVRVIDFGIAKAAEAEGTELTHTGWVVGSPAFMSPEQADGREPTPASDVFSLGAILAMVATGRNPFAGTSTPQTLYNVVHAAPDLGTLSPSLLHIVEPCLAKDPAARPTPAQLLTMLGPVAPAVHRWPPAVRQLIAAQGSEVDALLGDPERTLVPSPVRAGDTRVAPPPPPPDGHRPLLIVGTSIGLVLLVVGMIFYAFPTGGASDTGGGAPNAGGGASSPSASAEPADKYSKVPFCSEAAGKLPLPRADRKKDNDRYNELSYEATTSCSWIGTHELFGKHYWDYNAHAAVVWKVMRSVGGQGNGTNRLRERFGQDAKDKPAEPGFGEQAYWDTPAESDRNQVCSLQVRDGNLELSVYLADEKRHPAATCKDEARRIARAALAAVPR